MGFFYVSFAVTLLPVPPPCPTRRSRLVISLLITLAVAVPLFYLTSPTVHRWIRIGWLTSDDLNQREQGLIYLAAHAKQNPRLLAGAIAALAVQDNTNFNQIVDALQAANCWNRQHVPGDTWLRWISLHAHEAGIEAPALAAQRLAEQHKLADHPKLLAILIELSGHAHPDVRYNALCAAAELCLVAKNQSPYFEQIIAASQDDQVVIAHHASLFAYLLKVPGVAPPPWLLDLPPKPAEPAYDPQAIRNLLFSPEAPLRDVGCVLAVRDLSPQQLKDLIAELLDASDEIALLSAAILAGMTGEHTQQLHDQLEHQTDWATASVIKLGLWMQDGNTRPEIIPSALLAHGDVPRTTIILAMLHRKDPMAFEALLNPLGEAPSDLAALLEDYGWWRVLDRYLPGDAPRWVPTDTPIAQRYQIDLLRDWYLINRQHLLAASPYLTY